MGLGERGLKGTAEDALAFTFAAPGMFIFLGTKCVGEATRGGSGVEAEAGAEVDVWDAGGGGGIGVVTVVAGAEAKGGE